MITPPEEDGWYVVEHTNDDGQLVSSPALFESTPDYVQICEFVGDWKSMAWDESRIVRWRPIDLAAFLDDTDSDLLALVRPLLVELGGRLDKDKTTTPWHQISQLAAIGKELAE